MQGWVDHFETWRRDLLKRIKAESDAPVDYLIGADLIDEAACPRRRRRLRLAPPARHPFCAPAKSPKTLRTHATDPTLHELVLRYPDKRFATESDRELAIVVDPVRARFSAWYEFFPRSTSPEPGRHGTFADCEKRLPYISEMGFNVVYLPPIHPIGAIFRKGRNNNPQAAARRLRQSLGHRLAEGGHKSYPPRTRHPRRLPPLRHARSRISTCPWRSTSPSRPRPTTPTCASTSHWFRKRPDGTIQYAENPPKKYQDIYPFDFESEDWTGMWEELKSVFLYWIDQGVTIFRVDNPHTKAFPFWEWVITEIKRDHPEVLFLAEAFTRPKIMYRLAKLGFSQSYTYFPWRNAKAEITAYLTELTQTPVRDFFRPNQWPNTPDILTEFLQIGGRARLHHPLAAGRHPRRELRHLRPRLRAAWSIAPSATAAKNISTRKSTKSATGISIAPTACAP